MAITYRDDKDIESGSIRELFMSVNWPAGNNPDILRQSFKHSDKVFTARDDGKLIGLVNSISDKALTAYIPYLLVRPDYQKQGVGEKLVSMILVEYKDFERIVLLTEGDTVDFYLKSGFLDAQGIHVMMIRNS